MTLLRDYEQALVSWVGKGTLSADPRGPEGTVVEIPIIYKGFTTIPGGFFPLGFQPSTVCQARAKGGKVDVEPENVQPVDSGPVPFLRVQGHIFG